MGSQSTLFYIEELNMLHNAKHGGFSTCPFTMLNTNFDKINGLLPNSSKELDAIVQESVNALIALGIEVVLVPNITLFETLDKLNFETEIIHPIYATISEIIKCKVREAVIFGTIYTMESPYMKKIFASNGVEVIHPSKKEMLFIDDLRKKVYQKLETAEMLLEFNSVIDKYAKDRLVVIACTELSMVNTNKNERVFDMARIQIETAFRASDLI